jgi:hypothetical protein
VRVYPEIQATGNGVYYWLSAFILVAILVIYILFMIYVDYSIKIEKFYFNFPVSLLRYSNIFLYWILQQPIVEIFISIYSCQDGFLVADQTLQCWGGMHIFYCILFSICLLLYIVLFLLISSFYNESRPYHTDAFSRLDTNFETYITLYRILITIIGHFVY